MADLSPVSSSRSLNSSTGAPVSVVEDGTAELKQFRDAACKIGNDGYAFLTLAPANAGAVYDNLGTVTSGNWLMDLFRKIFSWIADGESNEKIRQELDVALSLQIQHCSAHTKASLSRLRILADTVAKNGASTQKRDIRHVAPETSADPLPDPIGNSIQQLRRNLASLENISANLPAIVDTDTHWPLDACEVRWIADKFIDLAEQTNRLNTQALYVTASVCGALFCNPGNGHRMVVAREV